MSTSEENRTLQDKFMLRLPHGMRDRIRHAADKNNRSMNAEILATLEEKYPAPRVDVATTGMADWLEFLQAAEDEQDLVGRVNELNRTLQQCWKRPPHADVSPWTDTPEVQSVLRQYAGVDPLVDPIQDILPDDRPSTGAGTDADVPSDTPGGLKPFRI